jgi:hypothetical protein
MYATTLRWLPVTLLAGVVLHSSAAAADKGDGFTPLFNGKDFTGWKFFLDPKAKGAEPSQTWSIKDNMIICTGQPLGYFYTEKPYKNYVLSYDWQYMQPPEGKKSTFNSGALVHIQEHKIWPKCIEVQGANKNHAFLYFLGAKKLDAKYDQATKDKVTKPIGEWNTTEITCKADGSIIAKINGTEVSSGKSDLTDGQIGFQSEGAEIHFRNIKIKELN